MTYTATSGYDRVESRLRSVLAQTTKQPIGSLIERDLVFYQGLSFINPILLLQ